jgi:hypothetical protein
VQFLTGGRDVLQRRAIRERVLAQRPGALGDVFAEVPAARCLAGLIEVMSSRTASSRTRTSGAMEFLIVEAECSVVERRRNRREEGPALVEGGAA